MHFSNRKKAWRNAAAEGADTISVPSSNARKTNFSFFYVTDAEAVEAKQKAKGGKKVPSFFGMILHNVLQHHQLEDARRPIENEGIFWLWAFYDL